MATAYWYGDHADLDAKASLGGFDDHGIHSSCREYDTGGSHRHAPVESLNLGAATKGILKCDSGIDLSTHYPSFVQKSPTQIKAILEDVNQFFFDPDIAI